MTWYNDLFVFTVDWFFVQLSVFYVALTDFYINAKFTFMYIYTNELIWQRGDFYRRVSFFKAYVYIKETSEFSGRVRGPGFCSSNVKTV